MPLQPFPKMPPYPFGCRSCPIAQCNAQRLPEENGVQTIVGWTWTCRERANSMIQDFNQCPIVDLPYFERQAFFDKYDGIQGEN